jgi:hypothetical protein
MINDALKETIKKELPAILEEDPEFREYILNISRQAFADKQETQDRFYEILADLRRDREEQARKWDEHREWVKGQEEKWDQQEKRWDEHREWVKGQEEKWDQQEKRWDEHREWVKAQEEKWNEHREWVKAQEAKWDQQEENWKEYREWVKTQKEKWDQQEEKSKDLDRKWWENQALIEARFQRTHEEIMAQAKKFDRSIGALGARWGIQSERAFRNALAGILEENFGVEVLNVNEYDDEGTVFGRPEQVELDVIIKNGLLLICELKSSIDKAGMYIFERKARFYEKRHNRKADRLIVISPMIDPKAQKVADRLGIETFSDSVDVKSI